MRDVQPAIRFKMEGSVVYVELCRRLEGLSLESCNDVAEYTRKFQAIDFELKSLDSDTALPEPYLIYLYLKGLGDAYQIFVMIYLQSHNLYGDNKVSFAQVSLAASNEELMNRSRKETSRVAMLVRNNGNSSASGRGRVRGRNTLGAIRAGSTDTHWSPASTRLPVQHVPAHANKSIVKRRPAQMRRKWRASRSIRQERQAKQGRR